MSTLIVIKNATFAEHYTKTVIVYCTCMNLHAEFAKVAVFITISVLTKIGPEDNKQPENCQL